MVVNRREGSIGNSETAPKDFRASGCCALAHMTSP